MEPWEDIVEIPEGIDGDYEILHETKLAGTPIPTTSSRTRLIGGQHGHTLVFDRDTRWHHLRYAGGTWMTDLPIEQTQLEREIDGFCGDVLIGGLGLGLAVNVLAMRPEVNAITVVEISSEVVRLVGPYVKDPHNKVTILTGDLFKFLQNTRRRFDYAMYDIWQSDGESTFHEMVVPLRELSDGIIDDDCVTCWNENVMRGQLFLILQSRYGLTKMVPLNKSIGVPTITIEMLATLRSDKEPGAMFWNWSVPFWKALKEGTVIEGTIQEVAGIYAKWYGRPNWQNVWGRYLEKCKRLHRVDD